MKNIKNKLFASLLAITAACSTIVAGTSFASTYTSTLDMASNSWFAGADRSYNSSNYYIKIKPKTLYSGSTSVDVKVCSKTTVAGIVWSYNELCGTTVSLPSTGSTYTERVGTGSSGTRCYTFSTSKNRGGFYADYVEMSST